MGFHKLQEIADWVQQKNLPFWKVVMQDDRQERNVSEEMCIRDRRQAVLRAHWRQKMVLQQCPPGTGNCAGC